MKNIHITSLGCPKNLVDTEVMLGFLQSKGWQVVAQPEDALVLLVNTCGFIQPAVEESIEEILSLAEIKKQVHGMRLVVTGCMVQRYKKKLGQEIPEIDLMLGTEAVPDVASLLEDLLENRDHPYLYMPDRFIMTSKMVRQLTTPFFRAWMKITEGCNNRCSYCMIPSIRGTLRSRQIDDLVEEAQILEKGGVKELTLVAQDLTAFGTETQSISKLEALVERLLERTSIPWVRLLYLYPTGVSSDLLTLMAENPRIVPYLDIPLQHVSDSVLRRMNRRYTHDSVVRLIEHVRNVIPEIAIRTTFLLGFPGEKEKDILLLEQFLDQARLDHVGVFAYANEEGCPSEKFEDQVDEEEKTRRVRHIVEHQSIISENIQKKFLGKIEPVLVEGVSRETDLLLEGRTRYQAPDIDGCVYINDGNAKAGDIVLVEITETQTYDLVGGIIAAE